MTFFVTFLIMYAAFFLVLLVSIPMCLLRGLIIAQLWGWFIAPYFVGAPVLTIPMAIGISFFIGLFTLQSVGSKADAIAKKSLSKKEEWRVILTPMIELLSIWFFSWVLHFYMPAATAIV